MSWGEVYKINSNMDFSLDVQNMIMGLTFRLNNTSVSQVLKQDKNVGKALNEAFGIGNTTLASKNTWAEILANSTSMTAIIGNTECIDLLLNCTYTCNDIMNNDTYWGSIIGNSTLFSALIEGSYRVRFNICSNAKALNRIVKSTTAKTVWEDCFYLFVEFMDNNLIATTLTAGTTYFTKTVADGNMSGVTEKIIGTSYSFVALNQLTSITGNDFNQAYQSRDNQVTWQSMNINCTTGDGSSSDGCYPNIVAIGGLKLTIDSASASMTYEADKYEAL